MYLAIFRKFCQNKIYKNKYLMTKKNKKKKFFVYFVFVFLLKENIFDRNVEYSIRIINNPSNCPMTSGITFVICEIFG